MTEPAEALAKLIAHYATDAMASRQVRRLPAFAVPREGNDLLLSLLKKLDQKQAAATAAAQT
jgi:hypothetical protein